MPVIEVDSTRNTRARNSTRRRAAAGAPAAAALAMLAVLSSGGLTGCAAGTTDAESSIVRTTTNIAGAAVVGVERDTRQACALPSAPDKPGADPQRIVVLDTAALDAVCALGLWERVVGAATVTGPSPQPGYLGTGLAKVPSVGTVGGVDPAKIAGLHPDLILGSTGDGDPAALQAVAPTVLTDGGGWADRFGAFAAALGRAGAGAKALDDYRTAARETGWSIAASFSQASVIRFTDKDIQVQGDDSFAAAVLTDTGVQRPTAQRGHSFTVTGLGTDAERAKVEGDLIYLMFDGPDGQQHGESVMHSKDWKKLGAVSDRREFAVDDTIWHGSGITAARAILEDLRRTLNGYVTD
ncbi:ABC transporter substrate-binding protein [Nocardia sp. alder85J]|uniref:ABC transporter substrate-binding protein n=1 Tax=Nocardia sp. alder85J TaxID=2862949 RepID=UPI001CD40A8E|nr:ABC transporter substrate-binding protein [Nocardia sp. alder85J]MCX4095295.1 ABC transporter substrate-binding protein [Nocardia sp. alder85J]